MKSEQNTICTVCGEEKGRRQYFGMKIPQKCRCEREREQREKEEQERRGEIAVRRKMLDNSGLKPIDKYPEKLSAMNLVAGQEEAHAACMRFCREFMEQKKFTGLRGFALAGGVGGGKTYLVGTFVRAVIGLCCIPPEDIAYAVRFGKSDTNRTPVRFVNSAELFSEIRDYDSGIGRDMLYECKNAPLLILDDLGVEVKNKTTNESLYRLLDHRMNNNLPTVFTINADPCQLRKDYGDRIYDRMRGMCDIIGVTTKSQRGMEP